MIKAQKCGVSIFFPVTVSFALLLKLQHIDGSDCTATPTQNDTFEVTICRVSPRLTSSVNTAELGLPQHEIRLHCRERERELSLHPP